MNYRKFLVTASTALALSQVPIHAQHIHISAGALAETPGSRLSFDNAESFVTNSGYVVNLALRPAGPAAGLYDGGPTFTALAIEPGNGGPDAHHALRGSQIALEWVSLEGPKHGSLAFWESPNCEEAAPTLTFKFTVGEPAPTNRFLLSQNRGEATADPYGHCHGRRFTTDTPGLYTLGVKLVDLSKNGPGGGPLHQPSETNYLYFQAGITIHRLDLSPEGVTATFATRNFGTYTLEATDSLSEEALWESVGFPVGGDNHLQTIIDRSPRTDRRYFRLRYETE